MKTKKNSFGSIVFALLVKDVIDLFSNVGTKTKEFPVYSMQRCLQKVSLARIF